MLSLPFMEQGKQVEKWKWSSPSLDCPSLDSANLQPKFSKHNYIYMSLPAFPRQCNITIISTAFTLHQKLYVIQRLLYRQRVQVICKNYRQYAGEELAPRSASVSWRQWPGDTLSYVSHCGDKTSGKDRSRKEGFTLTHSLGVQSTMEGKSRLHELGAAAHTASALRKKRAMNACAQLPVSF